MKLPAKDLTTVDMLRKDGLSRRKILRFIWDNASCEPDMVDVHNLLAKLKREEDAGTTYSDSVAETLDRFCYKDPFVVAHIDIDRQREKNVARCIVVQSTHMRAPFSAFPEVTLVDATHGTNASRNKLFSFMVHDSFGRGQHVQLV
ncbi:hypothetical protein PHMEG_00029572 [Phytophthora megakarya]|uniref:ZSWIM1/3 RNaseH-like domain-containing protein n=1 Tax=Phytophthora megakarya TaxID=4795 RepID=A0A225V2S7_9STRA|nr:hypothetical protein PHMEG_00029572 [Phytophthora megakarya]